MRPFSLQETPKFLNPIYDFKIMTEPQANIGMSNICPNSNGRMPIHPALFGRVPPSTGQEQIAFP